MHADKIIVLENGVINGYGTHNELLNNNDIYKEIYDSQLGGGIHEW
jgi:ATP-binding cassette subfamily B protein